LPDSVKVVGPLQAGFSGAAQERPQPDGMIEMSRDVVVTLPAIAKVGKHQGEMEFLWTDGYHKYQLIRWETTPLVHLWPPSIIIDPDGKPIEQVVTIASDDRPFRITKVCGALLSQPVDAPVDSGKTHRLALRLDPLRAVAGDFSTIVIGTDHPKHPELLLRALVLPPKRERRGDS
jgi:hypothetical protein